ncbi:MAG: hypothetical protein QM647_02030 [Asticcacaulis sp.]|uniref:hypothetical protein n=1 Tax=Asticcacaulis sp. TaxID=1872648 RepID=UPI0039E61E00
MTKPALARSLLSAAALSLAAVAVPCMALAGSDGAYLSWNNKSQADTATQPDQVQTASGAYAVPPSPYGQVGDPYARNLRWPAKQVQATVASNVPSPQQTFAPVPAPPVRAPSPISVSQPVPLAAPRPVAVVPVAAPQADDDSYPPDPGLADDPDLTPEAPITQPAPKATPQASSKPAAKAKPVVATAPPPAPIETAPTPPAVANTLSSDGAYEVPATSKYAARIAAARAAQLPTAEAPKDTSAPSTATAPEPDVSLASQTADHVFIPGEQYKTPADEPRLYSLHRQYGLKPDPIEVTPDATGALLTVSSDDKTSQSGDDSNDDSDTAKDKKTAAN